MAGTMVLQRQSTTLCEAVPVALFGILWTLLTLVGPLSALGRAERGHRSRVRDRARFVRVHAHVHAWKSYQIDAWSLSSVSPFLRRQLRRPRSRFRVPKPASPFATPRSDPAAPSTPSFHPRPTSCDTDRNKTLAAEDTTLGNKETALEAWIPGLFVAAAAARNTCTGLGSTMAAESRFVPPMTANSVILYRARAAACASAEGWSGEQGGPCAVRAEAFVRDVPMADADRGLRALEVDVLCVGILQGVPAPGVRLAWAWERDPGMGSHAVGASLARTLAATSLRD